MYTSGTAKRRVARLWAKEIFLSAHNLRLREGNAEAYFRLFPGKKDRSIIGQDKEPPSCATAAQPQTPAVRGFSELRYAVVFEVAARFRQSVRTDLSAIPRKIPPS